MDRQILINAISCLGATLDALNRAGNEETSKAIVVAKILELVNQL